MPKLFQQVLLVAAIFALVGEPVSPTDVQAPKAAIPNVYFGMHIHHLDWANPTPWPNVPVPSWRLWDAGVTWPEIEPNGNQFQFARLDHFVSLAEQHGTSLLLPLGMTPDWLKSPYTGNNSPPQSMDAWRTFVRTVATRYKGRIQAYEIWNEPNLKDFWTGTVDQMVALTKEAAQIIHEVNPTALVVSPSATADFGLPWFQEFLQKGGGQYVDVIGYHLYVAKQPEELVPLIQRVRQVMADNGVGNKPLWNTESGWIASARIQTEDLAGGVLARAFILAWATGVQRFYWYAWDNQLMGITTYNEPERRMTAAGRAFGDIQQWLVGARIDGCSETQDHTWICQLNQLGTKQWIVWNPQSAQKFEIPPGWKVRTAAVLLQDRHALDRSIIDIGPVPILLGGRF